MDLFKLLWDTVPATWKPYVGTSLFILYVITKIRSEFKSGTIAKLETKALDLEVKSFGASPVAKCVSGRIVSKPRKVLDKVVDVLF